VNPLSSSKRPPSSAFLILSGIGILTPGILRLG